MKGRVYRFDGAFWLVVARAWPFTTLREGRKAGPGRNVLIESAWPGRVEGFRHVQSEGRWWSLNGVRMVRPFRGLTRVGTL